MNKGIERELNLNQKGLDYPFQEVRGDNCLCLGVGKNLSFLSDSILQRLLSTFPFKRHLVTNPI